MGDVRTVYAIPSTNTPLFSNGKAYWSERSARSSISLRSEDLITKEKWELVSSHTARRSFATNLYLSGVALEDIALMMGHGKNIETTKRYICGERQITTRVMAYFLPEDRHKESEEYMRAYNDAITDSLQVIDNYLGLPDDNLAVLAIKGLQKI